MALPLLPIIAGGAGLLGTIYAADQGRKAQESAANRIQEAARIIGSVELPELPKYSPELLEYLGGYTPELEQLIQAEDSRLNDISIDPRLKAEQMAALEMISGLSEGGLSEADIAGLEKIRRQAGAQAQQQQEAALASMQQRGMAGSGAELIARMQAAQAAADRELDASLDISQIAQQRALQALQQRGAMAGRIREQDFNEAARIAAAQDAINQFNTNLASGRQQRNVDAKRKAQIYDVTTRQGITERNTGIRNEAQLKERERQQMMYNNELARAQGMAGLQSNMAELDMKRGATDAQLYSSLGNAFIQGGFASLGK